LFCEWESLSVPSQLTLGFLKERDKATKVRVRDEKEVLVVNSKRRTARGQFKVIHKQLATPLIQAY